MTIEVDKGPIKAADGVDTNPASSLVARDDDIELGRRVEAMKDKLLAGLSKIGGFDKDDNQRLETFCSNLASDLVDKGFKPQHIDSLKIVAKSDITDGPNDKVQIDITYNPNTPELERTKPNVYSVTLEPKEEAAIPSLAQIMAQNLSDGMDLD